jgi:hypothetical protein
MRFSGRILVEGTVRLSLVVKAWRVRDKQILRLMVLCLF